MEFSIPSCGSKLYSVLTNRIEDSEIHINSSNRDAIWEVVWAIANEEALGEDSKMNAVLFSGLFGTGKDYTAQWVRTKVSDILGIEIPMYMVAGIKSPEDVSKLYDDARAKAAEIGRCIIFDPEVDKHGKRGENESSEKDAILNQLLIEMQSVEKNKGVITINSTNAPNRIEPAYRRGKRAHTMVQFDPLDKVGRKAVLEIEAYRRDHQFIFDDKDLDHIVDETYGAVAADLAQMVTDIGKYVNLQLIRSLEDISKNLLFADEKLGKGELQARLKELPIEKLTEDYGFFSEKFLSESKKYVSLQTDIKEDDKFFQERICQRFARLMFSGLNPNVKHIDVGELAEGKKPIKWIRVNKDGIEAKLEHFKPSALNDMPFEETEYRFNSFGGLSAQTQFLKRVVENTIAVGKEGSVIFLYGEEGNGVTSLAKSIAGEYGFNLIVMYGADQESKWVGEVKDRLLEINERAKASQPSVVVFDNVRYLAQNVQTVDMSHKQTATSALKSMLKPTRGVIYVLTGENPAELDSSMRASVKYFIPVEAPKDENEYLKVWNANIDPEHEIEGTRGLNYQTLSSLSIGIKPGEIRNICRCFVDLGVPYSQGRLEKVIGIYKTHSEMNKDTGPINNLRLSELILSK